VTDSQVKPGLNLVNTGSTAVPLTTVTVRYWFTADGGASTFTTYCDYADATAVTVYVNGTRVWGPEPH